MGRGLVLL